MIGFGWKNQSLRPIGLDIGNDYIKMIQLVCGKGHISVQAAGKMRIDNCVKDDPKEKRKFIISAMSQMLEEGNFSGGNVISSLPGDKLKVTSLRLGKFEPSEIEQLLKKEVSQRFGLDPDKDVMNYMPAGTVKQGNEIKNELILFAASDETIKNHIELLEESGLRPVAIDTVPCALFRNFGRMLKREKDLEGTVVLIDVGSRFTTVVFGCRGEISFVKQIPMGGSKFNYQIANKLGVDTEGAETLRGRLRAEMLTDAGRRSSGRRLGKQGDLDTSTRQIMVDAISAVSEELAREMSLCFKYYTVTFRGRRLERAYFSGGEAHEGILLEILRKNFSSFGIEIEVAHPMKGFDLSNESGGMHFDSDRRGSLCEWSVAVGLGLKGWDIDR